MRTMSDCGCGCGGGSPETGTCCSLDTVSAPRFYCGQLLTDQDLTALVDWTRAKTRLARHRHGWGVVCGLDVRCDPARPGGVIVAPGYAVSCCGDDIIVAEETRHDLSAVCREGLDPCSEERATAVRAVDRPAARRAASAEEGEPPAAVPFDLMIAYEEAPADGRLALARGTCGDASACEHARVRETFRLYEVPGAGDPAEAAANRWRDGYDDAVAVIDAFAGAFGTLDINEDADVRGWLLRWLELHPPHHFCFVRDRICALEPGEPVGAATLSELLFWLVQDQRNAYLDRACGDCGSGDGVALARVWLKPPHGKVRDCHVEGIDPYWPYRRELALDAFPAPPGAVNLGQLIWHRRTEACVRLADLGVEIDGVTEFEPPEDLPALRAALSCDPFAKCGDRPGLLVHDDETFGARVIGFCAAQAAVTLTKTADSDRGPAGAQLTYTFTVRNVSAEKVDVVVTDDQLGEIGRDTLEPGASKEYRRESTLSQDATGSVTNTATATVDGKVVATDTHTFTIVDNW